MLRVIPNVSFGADPELFLQRNGKILGSEKVIPPQGLKSGTYSNALVIRDGVQVELNPYPSTNFRVLGRSIEIALELLQVHLRKLNEGVSINWQEVVEVEQEELDSLSPQSSLLGCAPSKNWYGIYKISDEAKKSRVRSAGGHLHIGLKRNYDAPLAKLYKDREDLVPFFDIFVGNTCVLLDRDPLASTRRQVYGRAGEYRDENVADVETGTVAPHHGIEYRTLSNFWLRNYTLMSLVFGLANIAISAYADEVLRAEVMEVVHIGRTLKAINNNDAVLAAENFEALKPFLLRHLPPTGFPLRPDTVEKFSAFAQDIQINGLGKYFDTNVVEAWLSNQKIDFSEFLT